MLDALAFPVPDPLALQMPLNVAVIMPRHVSDSLSSQASPGLENFVFHSTVSPTLVDVAIIKVQR